MFYCQNCVTPSTRPRLDFTDGICNACHWHFKKMNEIDWEKRWWEFEKICDDFRHGAFDVLCPGSGGKDGSYVAWNLKHKLGMTPLCVTFMPQMQTPLGRTNLDNFKQSGFDHITITPNIETYRKMSKWYFLNQGRPKWPFVMGIFTSVFDIAQKFGISFICWGEQGEVEYGGQQDTQVLKRFTRDFLVNIYNEGNDPSDWGTWWKVPSDEYLDNIWSTWWSIWEDWDPQHHARFCKEHTGFQMLVGGSIGTFTNYAQLDDMMQDLHAYMMFLKYGFGRCTSDASIEIRRGRMTREEGVKLVNKLDGLFPLEYLDAYLDYLDVTEEEFWQTVDKFANKNILVKTDKPERPWVLREKIRNV